MTNMVKIIMLVLKHINSEVLQLASTARTDRTDISRTDSRPVLGRTDHIMSFTVVTQRANRAHRVGVMTLNANARSRSTVWSHERKRVLTLHVSVLGVANVDALLFVTRKRSRLHFGLRN